MDLIRLKVVASINGITNRTKAWENFINHINSEFGGNFHGLFYDGSKLELWKDERDKQLAEWGARIDEDHSYYIVFHTEEERTAFILRWS